MKLGTDTPINTTLGAAVSFIATLGMGLLLWTQLADEKYVDDQIAEKCTAPIVAVQSKQEEVKDRNQKLDTAIQLLSQSVENHDKNMEAFTRALEQLRED